MKPEIIRTLNADKIVLGLPANAQYERPRDQVVKMEPMKESLMPETLAANLNKEQMEDFF